MRRTLCISAVIILLLTYMPITVHSTVEDGRPIISYAVIVQGSREFTVLHTAYFVRWVLQNVFNVPRNQIKHLVAEGVSYPPWLDYDDYASLSNVREAVQWLRNTEGINAFLYFVSHGGGYNLTHLEGGRWDEDGDEGPEHYIGGEWRGVDECIGLAKPDGINWEYYWDDDLAADINGFQSLCLTVMIQTCRSVEENATGTCYSGGFIDDLSGNYRTIITSSNETGVSWFEGMLCEFSKRLMTAFSDYEIYYSGAASFFDTSRPLNWQYKTWRGAFEYALQKDYFYLQGREHPWFDDDADGLPTYVSGEEIADFPWNGQELMRWLKADIDYDGVVGMYDIMLVVDAYGSMPGMPRWNKQADVSFFEDWKIDMADIVTVMAQFGTRT